MGAGEMKDETKARLDALLKKHDERVDQAKKREETSHTRERAFMAEFEKLVHETIRPVMEELGTTLKERGHDYQIATERPTEIAMMVYPSGISRREYLPTSTPRISFIGVQAEMKVTVHESTLLPRQGGRAGALKTWEVQAVTRDVVEEEVLRFLSGILGKWRHAP